jgi:hypothetical protein
MDYDIEELNRMSNDEMYNLAMTSSNTGVCSVSEFQDSFNHQDGQSDSVTALFLALYGDKYIFFTDVPE